jgi:predicted AAA+ superfamily ATPase
MSGSLAPRIYPRHVKSLVLEALEDTRVVFVMGARQVGKSTLTGEIAELDSRMTSVTLDDRVIREAALADPVGFLAALERPAHIDEVQRAPDLLLAIKQDVDDNRHAGRYLLTGSANVVATRIVKDALTGRMETIRLWPLAQTEIHESGRNLIDALFTARPPHIADAPVGRTAFADIVAAGGYPEARLRSGRRRDRWFASYLETTLDRDLREITDARKLDEVPRLLRFLASQAANLLSYRKVADRLDLNHETVREYVGLLQTVFLVRLLPAWRPGIGPREVQTPKCYLVDSGLLAHLLGADGRRIATDDRVTGKALENFVTMEVLKHADWAQTDTRAYHYRQRDAEIDLVLESRSGDIVALETKSAASLRASDWRPLEKLRDGRGASFKAGIVIYSGADTVPLGDRLWAVPVSGLWS